MKKNEIIDQFSTFLRDNYYKDLALAANEGKESLQVDFSLVDRFNPDLADLILDKPRETIELLEKSVEQIDIPQKSKIHIRFFNIPETNRIRIRNIRAKHIGKLLSVDGIVKRASEVRPEVAEIVYECPDCHRKITVVQTEKDNIVKPPVVCECGRRGGFRQISQKLYDARQIAIEEPFEITTGERPSEIMVYLKEDLTSPKMRNKTEPGNRIKVVGILNETPRKTRRGKKTKQRDIFLDANNIETVEVEWEELVIDPEDEKKIKKLAKDPKIFDKLVASLAPTMYGMEDVKLAVMFQLFGGEPQTLKDGTRIRGDIHILLVGDPASGKSQLMQLTSRLIPRGKYVSGRGVTGPGLCVSYDTLIPLAHGQIKPIGEIVENSLKQNRKEIEDGWVSGEGNTEIICLDPLDLKLKKKKVLKFFKLKPKDNLIKLRTKSGREIKLTKGNPVLTIENGELKWEQVSNIKPGQYIAMARTIPVNELQPNMTPDFAAFIGMISGDGDVGEREIRFHNTNSKSLQYVYDLSRTFGLNPRIYYPKNRVPCVRIASKDLCNRMVDLGVPRGRKSEKIKIPDQILTSNKLLAEFISGLFECDGSVVEKKNYIEYTTTSKILARQLQTALLRFGIVSFLRKRKPTKKGFGGKKLKYVISIHGKRNLKTFEEKIGFKFEKSQKLHRVLSRITREGTNVDVIPNLGSRLNALRKQLGLTIKNKRGLYYLRQYEYGKRNFSRKKLLKFLELLRREKNHEFFDFLETLCKSDIFWDEVKEVSETKEDWVYDLTVDDEHNFVANDLIIHNTATVVKDEQFLGGWVLEAGALVMSNKSLCAIDEFSKVSPQDQVALQEAMSLGTISIAKASIVATLPAQTAILAGGNPKLGRFDPYIPIREQVAIDDVLLSRFDLRFALRDVPNAEADAKLADHILRMRHFEEEEGKPVLKPEFLRKYIAYARSNVHPSLTREAGEVIKDFYLKMRSKAGEEAPVSITLRQYEALIRLAQSSAKIRLSNKVEVEDAQRAIRLMKTSLRQFGFDPETGMIDIDRAEGAITSAQRSKIRIVLDVIEELTKAIGKTIPVDEITRRAREEGVDDVDDILRRMQNEGLVFAPKPGFLQKI